MGKNGKMIYNIIRLRVQLPETPFYGVTEMTDTMAAVIEGHM